MAMGSRISSMDGWRAAGLSCVILSHFLHYTSIRDVWPPSLLFLGDFGVVALDGFFFISGYVITRGLLSENRRFGGLSLSAFYVRRAVRILPPLAIYLLVVSVLGKLGVIEHQLRWTVWSALFLCNLPLPGHCGWYVGHTWTLAFEEQFYLLLPLAMLASLRRGRLGWTLPLTAVFCVGSALAIGRGFVSTSTTLHVIALLLAGVAAAIHHARIVELLERTPRWVVLAAMCAYFSFPLFEQTRTLEVVYMLSAPWLIVVTLIGGPLHRTAFSRLLATAPLVYVGQLSYTMYLWQQFAAGFHGENRPPEFHLALLAGTIVFAVASYHLMELRLLRFGADYSQRRWTAMARANGLPPPKAAAAVAE